MPISYPYTQYTGIWNLSAASKAKGAGTWPSPPFAKLYSFGSGGQGQLGLGNTNNYSSPKQVGATTEWSKTYAVRQASYAIRPNGTLWSWGLNGYGQSGLGNTTYYSSPKQVGALTNWLEIAPNGKSQKVIALKTDGTLWSWGDGRFGQLGLGNTTAYSSPKQIGSGTSWSSIGQTCFAGYAIKTDGTLWSWGYGLYGQLGLNNTTYYSSPKQVGSLTNWLRIAGGYYHVIATKTDGTLWSWGRNNNGQLGLGTSGSFQQSPNQVGSLNNWSKVSCDGFASASIKTDGTLWMWGNNNFGQLGLGNTTNYSSPKQVGSLTDWLSIACGNYFELATKTDGTLWSWGYNTTGQLGQGNITNLSSPKQVGSLTSWLSISSGYNNTLGIAVN
jgi:alpha-tubulin suppressor-like RCC1 family protein